MKIRNQIKESINDSEITQGYEDIKQEYKEHKKEVHKILIGNAIVSIFLSGFIVQWVQVILSYKEAIYLSQIIGQWGKYGKILSVILFTACCLLEFRLYRATRKDYTTDRERNYDISKKGTYGVAHWQTEKEREECFSRTKDINETTDDILGCDEKGYIYSLRSDLVGINKNKVIFGSAGSGKSAAIIENQIAQNIRRGVSMIVTDSKGDLYARTCHMAKENGYIVRVLNLKAKELKNSDACHFLKGITLEDDSKAQTMANAIIENTGDGHMDYFAINEMNLLKALILYTGTNEDLIKNNRNTLAEVYNMCTKDLSALNTIFGLLDEDNPARISYNIFANCEPKVAGQILNGMAVRLQLLNNKYVKHIVSHDEIDLTLPMQKKCIYYVVISDTDTSYKFIATLFFTMLFIELCDYSDSLTKEEKKEQLAVDFVLDEYANTGAIPDMDVKVSTFRSRKITATFVLQSKSQLDAMYEKGKGDTILGNITTHILLKAGNEGTAKYFSTLCGVQTIRVKNRRYDEGAADIIHSHEAYGQTEGIGKRELLMVDEALHLSPDDMIVCVLGFQPIKLKKYIASLHHPMYQNITEMKANQHIPEWRREEYEKECAAKKRRITEPSTEKPKTEQKNKNEKLQKVITSSAKKIETAGRSETKEEAAKKTEQYQERLIQMQMKRNATAENKFTQKNMEKSEAESDDNWLPFGEPERLEAKAPKKDIVNTEARQLSFVIQKNTGKIQLSEYKEDVN